MGKMNEYATHMNLVEKAKERTPKLFKLACPRNIDVPVGYASPELLGAVLCGHIKVVNNPLLNQRAHNTSYAAALCLISSRAPTYFIADEFAEAVANTDLPGDFKMSELKWPLPAQTFVLSDHFCRKYYGQLSPFLSIAKLPEGTYPGPPLKPLPQTECQYPRFMLDAEQVIFNYPMFGKSVSMTYNGRYPMDCGIEIFGISDWHDATKYEEQIYSSLADLKQEMTEKEEHVFAIKAQTLAVKLLLTISEMPALVEHGKVTKHARVDQATRRVISPEVCSPNVIGRNYRIPRHYSERAIATGQRAAPRFKYRRGHYTWQAIRRKNAPFISVDEMPRKVDGFIDFDAAGADKTGTFRACHERKWIEGFFFDEDESTPDANPSKTGEK